MPRYIHIIAVWAILQMILIVVLGILIIITQFILRIKNDKSIEIKNKIDLLLKRYVHIASPISDKDIQFFNRYITEFIICVDNLDEQFRSNPAWMQVKLIISNNVFKHHLKKLSFSFNWLNRYLATRCFNLGINIYNEDIELFLLKDKKLLIAVNAAMEILQFPTKRSINELIDIFSKARYILRTALITFITEKPIKHDHLIVIFIWRRLEIEKNIYVKIFCYDLLSALRPSDKIASTLENDLLLNNVHLKMAILKYLFHTDKVMSKKLLLREINSEHKEIRAVAARFLGNCQDLAVIPYLKEKLSDKSWWVRIQSAEAIANYGAEGLNTLKTIQSEEDKFAYETAQAYLNMKQNRRETKF